MASASGFFELEVVELQNPAGRLANGDCCRSNGAVAEEEQQCTAGECATYFRLCLKEYQSNVTVSSPCTYGNDSSPVLAGNSFTFVEPHKSNARLVLPFTFRWTVSFSFSHLHTNTFHPTERTCTQTKLPSSSLQKALFPRLVTPVGASRPAPCTRLDWTLIRAKGAAAIEPINIDI